MLEKRLSVLRGTKTQQEVADALGISRARYAHYESGRNEPDLETLIRLADYFHVRVDDLLGRSNFVNEEKQDYKSPMQDEIREIAEFIRKDPDSRNFWSSYKAASPKKRKEFLRTWQIITELGKKDP